MYLSEIAKKVASGVSIPLAMQPALHVDPYPAQSHRQEAILPSTDGPHDDEDHRRPSTMMVLSFSQSMTSSISASSLTVFSAFIPEHFADVVGHAPWLIYKDPAT